MKHPEVATLMAQLFFDEPGAKAILVRSGFPPGMLPQFTNADAFWSSAVLLVERGAGATDLLPDLLADAARMFPGNADARALQAKLGGAAPPVTTPSTAITAEGPCHTLTLIGADLPDEFIEVIREQFGSEVAADLLYVSRQQCSVAIPDPGSNAAHLQQQIQELMQTHAPSVAVQVIYEKYQFRPYLLSNLTVFGPDTTPYSLQSVPSTATPRDIAAAIVAETRGMTDRSGGPVSTVIDLETEAGSDRLVPEKTLHENNVQDKDKLRVGTRAVAGNISPEQRMEAQLRMRAQIRRFALGHPEFEIADADNEDLPNRLTFELEGPGLAPPTDLAEFLAGSENMHADEFRDLPWHRLQPVRIDFHRISMHLPAMFPVVAPFVVWQTPVFHPNIWREPQPGIRPGVVCLGPLMDTYRPDLDFGYVCQLIVDIGTYRNYDVVDADTFPDPSAALWARTEPGQKMIQSLGAPPMRPTTQRADERRIAPPLWVSLLADRQAGAER